MTGQISQSLQVTDRHKVISRGISVDDTRVEAADNIKYVGMWLDTSFTIKKASGNIVQQGTKKYGIN